MPARIYRARVFDTPHDPFDPSHSDGGLRSDGDVALVVTAGVITWRGPMSGARTAYPDLDVVDLRDGLLIPGMVDTHVHFPQVRAIGGLGMPLLEWLERCALPEEVRLDDHDYATGVARDFLDGLRAAGTTTALVFGSHFATAIEALFEQAEPTGLRITAGHVVSDRHLRPELHTDPATALAEGNALIERWHGRGLLRYAVTPRFALSASDQMLDVCAQLVGSREDVWFTSHSNENVREVAAVAELFPSAVHYLDTYHQHGLMGPRSVLAHNVHATDAELSLLAATGASVAHCPTSNASLGSGLFPLRRHLDHGVSVALGSDVGAGAGFSLLKEGLQAYFAQQLLGQEGFPLTPAHLLHLATSAGARALGLADQVGDLSVGKAFDAVLLRPRPGSTFEVALRHAADDVDALAKVFVLGTPADVAGVWVAGRPLEVPSAHPG